MIRVSDDLEVRQSSVVKAMRFPLIVLVLIAHSAGVAVESLHWPLDGTGRFIFFSEMISRHLCPIGVCWFYVFSGYFFFRNLGKEAFDREWIIQKWEKRIRSLLLPFIIWNLIAVSLSLCIAKIYSIIDIHPSSDPITLVLQGPLYWFITGPADFPLYFLRDLMIMSLGAPLIYFVEKKAPVLSMVLLVLFYLSAWTPAIPHYRSVFFFSLGAWAGIHKRNILAFCRKAKIPAAVLAALLLPLSTCLIGHPIHELARRLFFPFGMITMMNLCDSWIDKERIFLVLKSLSSSVFFIFAAHEIFILGWTKGILQRVFGDSLLGMWIRYMIVPIVVLFICLGLYHILNKLSPKALAIACGERAITK